MTEHISWADFEEYLARIAQPANPRPPDLGIVRALMLWPDNITMREHSATRAFFDYLDDLADAPSDVKNFAYRLARGAFGAAELEKAEDERIPRGLLVGSVLYSMTTCNGGENFNFTYHINKCNQLFLRERNERGKNVYRYSKKTFDNDLWPTFRSVSHYLAASYKHLKVDGEDEFPCALDKIQEFLALANFIRAEAEARRPFKSPSPILRAGEALSLPAEFVRMSFVPSEFSRDK
jgi:hypothetical protein